LQSANPGLHETSAHTPFEHVDAAFGKLQTFPHEPQLLLLANVLISHPSAGLLLQSTNPGLHEAIEHTPFEHVDTAFGKLQTRPHTPQLLLFVNILISHPSAAI
jgi:hypothetical protein